MSTLTYQIFQDLTLVVHGSMSHIFQLHQFKISGFTTSILRPVHRTSMQNKSQMHEKAL